MKEIKIIPIKLQQINHYSSFSPEILEKGDCPRCSRKQVEYFLHNWKKILPPRIIRSIKKHKDVLHGAQSVNMLVGKKYSRPTNDYDVYSKEPYNRAKEIEDELDKACGCDIAYIEKRTIPNVSGRKDELMSKYLYTIKTPHEHYNGDVDYMKLPPKLPIIKRNGILHEALEEAYRKAQRNMYHPFRANKALKDMRRIEAYWKEQEKRRRR